MWLNVSTLSPYNLHMLYSVAYYQFSLEYNCSLFCAAIRRDSVSYFRFSVLGHAHVISYAISAVCRLKYPYSCFLNLFYFLIFNVFLFILVMLLLLLGALISIFCSFQYTPRDLVLMYQRNPQCWRVISLPLLLTYNLCHLGIIITMKIIMIIIIRRRRKRLNLF